MAHTEVDTPVYTPQSGALGDYFTFRMMVSPVMIRIVYALGAIGITIASFPLMFHGSDTTYYGTGTGGGTYFLIGLAFLTIGNLVWRVLCEQAILFFSIHERLRSMEHSLRSPGTPAPVPLSTSATPSLHAAASHESM